MSTKRMFSLFVGLVLVVAVVLTVRAGSATSEVQSTSAVMLDQHERHAGLINPGVAKAEQAQMAYRQGEWSAAAAINAVALDQQERHVGLTNLGVASAEQARMEYRQGEWTAAYNIYAALDAQERHAVTNPSAEQARLDYRRGEWGVGTAISPVKFDIEQDRIQWRAGM